MSGRRWPWWIVYAMGRPIGHCRAPNRRVAERDFRNRFGRRLGKITAKRAKREPAGRPAS